MSCIKMRYLGEMTGELLCKQGELLQFLNSKGHDDLTPAEMKS